MQFIGEMQYFCETIQMFYRCFLSYLFFFLGARNPPDSNKQLLINA